MDACTSGKRCRHVSTQSVSPAPPSFYNSAWRRPQRIQVSCIDPNYSHGLLACPTLRDQHRYTATSRMLPASKQPFYIMLAATACSALAPLCSFCFSSFPCSLALCRSPSRCEKRCMPVNQALSRPQVRVLAIRNQHPHRPTAR
jgi:hypothetical protein